MREQIVTFGGCLMDTTVTRMKKMEDRSRLTLKDILFDLQYI